MPRSVVPMPGRVRVVLVLLALYALFLLFTATSAPAPRQSFALAGLTIVFIVFLARGHPLARQWAQYVGLLLLLGAIVFAFPGAPAWPDTVFWMAVLFTGGIGAVLLWGLSGPDARMFFDIYCRHCRSFKIRPKGLLFNRVRCRGCGRIWRVHDPRIDAEVFD